MADIFIAPKKGGQRILRGNLESDLLRVVGNCLRSTVVIFEFPEDVWVGQKLQKTVFLQCGPRKQNRRLELPYGG